MFGKQNDGNRGNQQGGNGWNPNGQQSGNNQQQNQNNNQQTQQNQNNSGNDDEPPLNIWDEPAAKKSAVDNTQQQNQQQNNQPQGTQQTPEEQLQAHLTEIGLDPIEISDAEKAQFLESGDLSPLIDRMNDKLRKGYLASMKNMNILMKQSVEDAVKKATSATANSMETDKFRNQMHTELPFTADPRISPIAEGIAKRALLHGKTSKEAIAIVRNEMSYLHDQSGKFVSPNTNTGGNFSQRNDEATPDWLDVLSAKG